MSILPRSSIFICGAVSCIRIRSPCRHTCARAGWFASRPALDQSLASPSACRCWCGCRASSRLSSTRTSFTTISLLSGRAPSSSCPDEAPGASAVLDAASVDAGRWQRQREDGRWCDDGAGRSARSFQMSAGSCRPPAAGAILPGAGRTGRTHHKTELPRSALPPPPGAQPGLGAEPPCIPLMCTHPARSDGCGPDRPPRRSQHTRQRRRGAGGRRFSITCHCPAIANRTNPPAHTHIHPQYDHMHSDPFPVPLPARPPARGPAPRADARLSGAPPQAARRQGHRGEEPQRP